ncbi:adenylate/guanylate cyclase domain-containing protein [Microscilla marina]|uniref:Adenylate cyclase n=1 Tax=Microscilla marina ATCC 23134 TaxID=313606 RepID=A1ZSW5_MICM2|nr:adenylate/guanylate cyclase domain-containing protein [Microscilla marina]EAY26529.1 adenylate cyclase [Microscilla marina ATCC 23134]
MHTVSKPRVSLEERIEILKNVDIFSTTNEKILANIASKLKEGILKAEQAVFHKGDQGEAMYIIADGAVKVHDKTYVFAVLRKGQVFGEYSMLDTEARSASVSGVVKTRLLKLEQRTFYEVMLGQIEILRGILQVLIKRSRRQNYFEEKLAESNRLIQRKKEQIKQEKAKSDELLLNILPEDIAEELKASGRSEARNYNTVSVLFADIKGFTTAAEKMSAADVVKHLEYYFTAFDEIMEKYELEKIKTIGDAYMAAGGIPQPNTSNSLEMVCAALEMQNFMRQHKEARRSSNDLCWELRLGINTGPLVAGVIGKNKFAYDVWGDTVNTASRMESNGEVNKVNISGVTHQLVKDYFECEYRGKVNVKGKGEVDMYFVNRIKPEFASDQEGVKPSAEFIETVKEIRAGKRQ